MSPKHLSHDELTMILVSLNYSDIEKGLSEYKLFRLCVFVFLADTGLRVGEFVQLLVSDLFFNGDVVTSLRVRAEISKSGRERIVPISQRLRKVLSQYRQATDSCKSLSPAHFLFSSCDPRTHISVRQVERLISILGATILGIRLTPHMLRHTFATRALAVSNMKVVQGLLGHRSINSTQIYTHPGLDELKKTIDKM